MNSGYQRRAFFKKAAMIAGAMAITPFCFKSVASTNTPETGIPDKNLFAGIDPSFGVYCLKNGSIELFQKTNPEIRYTYQGVEVGILLLIINNKPLNANLKEIADLHSLPVSVCKTKTDHVLAELKTKGVIC